MDGFRHALDLFKKSSSDIPAYKKFLSSNNFASRDIQHIEDFERVPITDKKNYIINYPVPDLFEGRKIPPMAYASSGSSGTPTFWFRDDAQEELGGKIHETIFRDIFKIKKSEKTLVIICFSMGIWIAGNYTLAACRYISKKGYRLTTATPGLEPVDILHTLSSLGRHFRNIIFAGYPPFLMNVITEALDKKLNLDNRVKFISAGDKFSEKWRDDLFNLAGIDKKYESLIGIYGSADAGILGHETPLSIFIRKEASANRRLATKIFGKFQDMPGIVQYSPGNVFFEEVNGELVITTATSAPLIRYNIHDTGNIISFRDMKDILANFLLSKKALNYGLKDWKLPFIVLKGRTDVAVTFYAINIYPEHIRAGIIDSAATKFLSGNFFAYNKSINKSKHQMLYIHLQLAPKIRATKKLSYVVERSILRNLCKNSIEFRKLHDIIGHRSCPTIVLHTNDEFIFELKNRKQILATVEGKKPKMVL